MPGLIIKPRSRLFHGHDWVYASDVQKTFGDPVPGSVVSLKDFKDRPLGSAIYNPHSQIVARRFSWRKQDLDAEFFQRRLGRAFEYRQRLVESGQCAADLLRLVWSESDGLPGVVIDRYADSMVLQTLTLAMDQRKQLIVEALTSLLPVTTIIERNEAPIRSAEGLPSVSGVLHGPAPQPFRIETSFGSLSVDLLGGQKTGLYLDQLENCAQVARFARGRRVLDCFCNQGAFALACAKAGAQSVLGVDASGPAVAAAAENALASGVSDRARFIEGNVFDFLKAQERELSETPAREAEFDFILLDPPSFTRNKGALADALRGYKEINLRALKLLRPGGHLSTFTCSHHVGRGEFLHVIRDAAVDAKKSLRQVAVHTQRGDHPILATIPETEYLKGYTFELMAAW
ncbi:MAG: class I SAM-dependent rRNA methyltransferase [Verrucomicrobiales bacterium]